MRVISNSTASTTRTDIDWIAAERLGSRNRNLTTRAFRQIRIIKGINRLPSNAVRTIFPSIPVGHITTLAEEKISSPSKFCVFFLPFLPLTGAELLDPVSELFTEPDSTLEMEGMVAFIRRVEIRGEWDEIRHLRSASSV